MKFESRPKIEDQEKVTEEIELEPKIKEGIEVIADRTVGLVTAESKLEEEIPEGQLINIRKSGILMKFVRAAALVTALTAVGGAANTAEAGSWNTKRRQTTGDVLKDIGIRVGGAILREKMERDYEKTKERIRELENELRALEEDLDKKQKDLKDIKVQEKVQEVMGADMSDMIADTEAEIQRLIGEIDARAKEMDKLRKSSVWKDAAREGIRGATGGRGSWRVNR